MVVLRSVRDKTLQGTSWRVRDPPAVPGLAQDRQPIPAVLSDPRLGIPSTLSVRRKFDFKE